MFDEEDEFRLTVIPCLEKEGQPNKIFTFSTMEEMKAAHNSMADLLLFLQDDLKVMYDFSNLFVKERLVNGEWEELDEIDTNIFKL